MELIKDKYKETFEEITHNNQLDSLNLILGTFKILKSQQDYVENIYFYMKILAVVSVTVALVTIGVFIPLALLRKIVRDTPNEIELQLNMARGENEALVTGSPDTAVI